MPRPAPARASLAVALTLTFALAAGCGATRSEPYTLGRYRAASEHQLFERVLHALLERRYAIAGADERAGTIEVRARGRQGRRSQAIFVVRLVRPGWIVITTCDEDGVPVHEVHRTIAHEHAQLALHLRASLEQGAGR